MENKTSTGLIKRSLNQKWIKAAVIGSLWAAIEIIAGSFLHNLHIPFAGTMLSMGAVFMLVAFIRHWPERGIIIRAGIIAALMKSVSPSAIILGPMIGILMEAVFLEISCLLLGRNIAGYILGGMLAVSWALFQKVLNLLILYGFDLVRIADAFYRFLVSKTGMVDTSPVYLIILMVSIYALAGMLAAIAGSRAYSKLRSTPFSDPPMLIIQQSGSPFLQPPEKQRYASFNLFLVIVMMVGSMLILSRGNLIAALILGFALILFVLLRYKNSIKRLRKVSIWIQVLLITLLATLLWEWINTGKLFTLNGFVIGLLINFRAMIVIFSFSAISVELRNPIVRSLLYRNGLSNLYKAVSLAFTTLPAIIEQLPQLKNIFRQRAAILERIFNLAEGLLEYMNREPDPHSNIYILTGEVHSGKTTFTGKVVDALKKDNLVVGGFLVVGTFVNEKRNMFQLTDLLSDEKITMASVKKERGWFRYKKFYFNPSAFKKGARIIDRSLDIGVDAIIIDEVGPMELLGKGWYKVLEVLGRDYRTPQIWVVREKIRKEVQDRWHIPDENVFEAGENEHTNLSDRIKNSKLDL